MAKDDDSRTALSLYHYTPEDKSFDRFAPSTVIIHRFRFYRFINLTIFFILSYFQI